MAGVSLSLITVLILIDDTACVDHSPLPELQYKAMEYCWTSLGSAFYNTLAQFFFFLGLTLVLIPGLVNASKYLRTLMDSHLWHVLEELTFSAYLLQLIVVTWFFASRT